MAPGSRWISLQSADSRIRYDEGWYPDSSGSPSWRMTTQSKHSGRSFDWTNKIASLSFNFTGMAVKVHGGASSNFQASWECFVDEKRLDLPSKAAPVEGNHHQLCRWMGADTSAHVLTLKVTRLPPGQRLWVDTIQYLATNHTHAAAIESPIPIVLDDYSEAALMLEPREESTKEGVPPVLIAVGVLGGLALIGTLVIFYWLRKRQKQHGAALELKERGILLGLRGMSSSDIGTPRSTGAGFDGSSAVHLLSPDFKLPQMPPGLESSTGREMQNSAGGAFPVRPSPARSIR